MKSINVLAVSNGVGITRDMELIRSVLTEAGFSVECNSMFRFQPQKKYDLNIFLERFKPDLFSCAGSNVMIPNQEWFEPGWASMLHHFDCIFTKTKFADDVFQNLGCRTEYISFTSEDRYLPDVKKDHFHWLHLAGKSIQKQTDLVVRTWEHNPGFPQLTIIQDPKFWKPRTSCRNINYCCDRFSDDLLKVIQNSNAVHVCPSETEGFGHYIVEAMSCKASVITTDAAPMTELVGPDMGFFVKPVSQERMRLSLKYSVSEQTLSEAVTQALVSTDHERIQMGERARAFFLENDAIFRRRLVEAVNAVSP